jgi:glutathione S-transferase
VIVTKFDARKEALMLELYFRPFACSLASRIALLEAGIEARYVAVDLTSKRLAAGGDFFEVSNKGRVPVLRLEDGSLLSEGPAVLQYIADRSPEARLAPPPSDPERYRLQEWLNFVTTELHKAFLAPLFSDGTPEDVRNHARAQVGHNLGVVAAHLETRPFLLGEHFTVADAYLVWVLILTRYSGFDLGPYRALSAYLDRTLARPRVAEAVAIERELLQAA